MVQLLVSDLMDRNPLSVRPDTNLFDCAKIMVRKRSGALILKERGKFFGIITTRDILWALIKKSKEDLSKIKAIEISPKKILTLKPDATIEEALIKMKSLKIKRIPVIKDNKIVGVINITDIINLHSGAYSELKEFSELKEEEKNLRVISKKAGFTNTEGNCERCGKRNFLQRFNGTLVCNSCLSSL